MKISKKIKRISIAFLVISVFISSLVYAEGIGDATTAKELGAAMVAGLENLRFFRWIMAALGVFVMLLSGVLAVKELACKNFGAGIGYAIGIIPGWYLSEWIVQILQGAFK